MPRPPEITTLAAVSSGRADCDSASLTKCERPFGAGTAIFSTGAAPPSGLAVNAVVRMVSTFLACVHSTVWIALPA